VGTGANPTHADDVLAIMKVISTLAHAQDDRDVELYRSCLADEVFIELPMVADHIPRMVPADDWVDNAVHGGNALFYVTQHRLFNHVIDVDGDDATCDVDLSAIHQEFEHDGATNTWIVGGRYYIKLRRIDGRWLICARTLEYRFHTGAPAPHGVDWSWAEGRRRQEARPPSA
jgi:hypothetical protein